MRFGRRTQEEPGFLMTPMIDVMFLLLLFFISTSLFHRLETELDVSVPVASHSEEATRAPGDIIVNVRNDGAIVVNQRVLLKEQLIDMLKRLSRLDPRQGVTVRGDRFVAYEKVMDVFDACAAAGIYNLDLAAIPKDQPEEGAVVHE